MANYDSGKGEVVTWIKNNFPEGSTCLDVGPCDGKWFRLLGDYLVMDAVEIYEPNIENNGLRNMYREIVCGDIADCVYNWYDLIIFGDVIEHMDVEKAQRVLEYARNRCRDMIVAVPYLYRQGPNYGNQWEIHVQEDLTPELFDARYPGFRIIHRPVPNYAYYAKAEEKT